LDIYGAMRALASKRAQNCEPARTPLTAAWHNSHFSRGPIRVASGRGESASDLEARPLSMSPMPTDEWVSKHLILRIKNCVCHALAIHLTTGAGAPSPPTVE
jgi:hypothetical protein